MEKINIESIDEKVDIKSLREELEHFQKEKEKIRQMLGRIGGNKSAKRDRVINLIFIFLIVFLFVIDTVRHFIYEKIPLPTLFSLELGVLLVSIKIIWMMHRQSKVDHFQFWILNTIEFRINSISKKLNELSSKITQL